MGEEVVESFVVGVLVGVAGLGFRIYRDIGYFFVYRYVFRCVYIFSY